MTTDRFSWHDKIVLVTGAASGIGLALATEMLRRGATVWLGDTNPAIHDLTKSLNMTYSNPDKAKALQFNVADFDSWKSVVAQITSGHRKLDFVFNNAGIGFGCDSADLTIEHYERYIDVNIRGVTNSIALIYPLMIKQGYGTIVNTSSMGGLIPSALMTPYAMTKHAVVGLSESLRLEAKYKGINVITLCPGSVNTPIFDSIGLDGLPIRKFTNLGQFAREQDTSIAPEEFARLALNDIEQNKTLIIYPRLMRILVWIYRYFPWLYVKLTEPNLRQEMKRLGQ